jgi:hypothetical protein
MLRSISPVTTGATGVFVAALIFTVLGFNVPASGQG